MFARREFVVGGAALALLPEMLFPASLNAALAVPPTNRLAFEVMRKGTRLGSHVLTFAPQGNRLTVQAEVTLTYKLLGITLYHYKHHCTEVWDGTTVMAMDSHTDDNGTAHQVTARRGASGLVVQSKDFPSYTAPENALPATHWNPRELDGPWINPQDGKLLRPRVTPSGLEKIPAAGGRSLQARRYDLTGEVQMVMWYDRMGLAGISFDRGGSPIRYERQA